LKIILFDHQNNYVEHLNVDKAANSFDILAVRMSYIIILMIQTKLFLDVYLVKILDTSRGRNGFVEVSKNLTEYRFENNFVEASEQIFRTFKR